MAKSQGILRHWGKKISGLFYIVVWFSFLNMSLLWRWEEFSIVPFRVATSSDWIKNQQVAVWEHALAVLNQQRSLAGTWLWLWRFNTFHIKQHIDDSLYCTVTLWWHNPSKCLKLGWDWCFCQVQKYNGWFAENPMFCSQFMDDETWSPKKDFTTNTNSPKNPGTVNYSDLQTWNKAILAVVTPLPWFQRGCSEVVTKPYIPRIIINQQWCAAALGGLLSAGSMPAASAGASCVSRLRKDEHLVQNGNTTCLPMGKWPENYGKMMEKVI